MCGQRCQQSVSGHGTAHSLLEGLYFFVGQGIRFSNDGDEINTGVEAAHDFNIQRLQRVAGGLDKVYTSMYTIIHNIHAVDLILSVEICVKALFNVLDDRLPRVVIVDKIAEARRINNCQT